MKFLCYAMQTACLRLMGKKLLVALTMEGRFAGEGLQNIDEDDDMLSAMARELVERNGIGETADAVWKALNTEHQKLFPTISQPDHDSSSVEMSGALIAPQFDSADLGKRPLTLAQSSSSDSDRKRFRKEGGGQERLSPSRRRYSA